MVFIIFTGLCNHHYYLILQYFHHPKRKAVPDKQLIPIPLPDSSPWQLQSAFFFFCILHWFQGGDSAHRESVILFIWPCEESQKLYHMLKQTEAKLWVRHIKLCRAFSLGFLPFPFLSNNLSHWTWENSVNYRSWLESHPLWIVNYEHITLTMLHVFVFS